MTRPKGPGGFEPRTTPAERRDFFDQRRILGDLTKQKMAWAGPWTGSNNPYDYRDVVTDDGWLMVCDNPDGCTERPSPQPTGPEVYVYDGTSPTRQDLAKQILFGNRYTWTTGGYLTGYRIWTVAGNQYVVYSVSDPDGANQINELVQFTGQGGWEIFGLDNIVVHAGTVFELLCIVQEPDPTPTVWTGNWNYTTPPNVAAPTAGVILHANEATGLVRINKTDNDGGNRATEIDALEVGDVIEGPNVRWSIQSIADNGTWTEFGVAPAIQDTPDGVASFSFETVTPTPITTLEDPDFWTTSPFTVQGVLAIDDATPTYSDNAYGTDISIQAATVSDEWVPLSAPSGGGGGGGGGSSPVPAPELLAYSTTGLRTFTKASYPGMTAIKVRLQGAGGGGGGAGTTTADQSATGGGGGAGAYAEALFTVDELEDEEDFWIGAGGVGGTGTNNGSTGADTWGFGIIAPGGDYGRGGAGVTSTFATGLGAQRSSLPTGPYDYRTRGSAGAFGMGAGERNAGGVGATSVLGAGGNHGNAITSLGGNGGDGDRGGGGGGGANRPSQGSTRQGGSGGDGALIIEVFYGSDTAAAAAAGPVSAAALGTHVDFYEYAKFTDVLDIGDTWTPVGTLDLNLPANGTYEIGASSTWTFTSTAKSVFTRWRINGGTWNERVQEPKDAGDIYTNYYAFPSEYSTGPFLLEVEMRKEDAVGTLDLLYLDLFMERKK